MDNKITEDAIYIKDYIAKTWPRTEVSLEVPLRDIFKEPENVGLKHIWKYGSADVVVKLKNKIVAIVEPGGSQHFNDEKQMRNDRRKYMLCKKNGVRCLKVVNGLIQILSNRKKRQLLGSLIYSEVESDD